MRIDILTLFPDMFKSPFEYTTLKKALIKKKVNIHFNNIRNYTTNKYKQVDDRPYGGEAGMVMMIEPIHKCIEKLKKERKYDEIIFLAPDGEIFNQKIANEFSLKNNIIILCGHYKGIDQRVRDHLITREISIGNFVLSGGELAALVFCDAIIRIIPGVIGNESAALSDSFQDNLIAPPIYTRPANYNNWKVPKILTSGNSEKIETWKEKKALQLTQKKRPDLT